MNLRVIHSNESHNLTAAESGFHKPRIRLGLSLSLQSSLHCLILYFSNQFRPSFLLVQDVLYFQLLLLRSLNFLQLEFLLFLFYNLFLDSIQLLQLSFQSVDVLYFLILVAYHAQLQFSVLCSLFIQRKHLVLLCTIHQLLHFLCL